MSRHIEAVQRFVDGTALLIRRLLGVVLIAMVALNVANAVGRYLFRRSIDGADEILIFTMAWLVFIGAAVVTWEGRHLRLDLLGEALSARLRRWLGITHLAVVAGLSFFVMLQSADFVGRVARIGQLSMAAEIPMTVPHAALAVGFGLAGLLALTRLAVEVVRPAAADESGTAS